MHSIRNLPHSVRVFNHIHPFKYFSGQYLHFLHKGEAIKSSLSSTRIICTASFRQGALSHKYLGKTEIVPYQDSLSVPVLVSKNNAVSSDSHYKQIYYSMEYHGIENIIQDLQFKDILASSSFYYDVNLIENSQRQTFSSVYYHSFEDLNRNYLDDDKLTRTVHCVNHVLMSSNSDIKENTRKPTESQLRSVIDKLTHQLHNFFNKTQDFSFYHKNIIFQNNIKGITMKGLPAYIQTMYLLKIYGRLRFVKVNVDILKITHHIEDGTVRVRWRVRGVLFHKMLMKIWKTKSLSWNDQEEAEWLDGFSVFSVGEDGLIYHHVCDKMTPNSDDALAKKSDLKSKILGLLELSPRGPATGSLNALIPYCRSQEFSNFKKST